MHSLPSGVRLRGTGDGTSIVTVWAVFELPHKTHFHHYQQHILNSHGAVPLLLALSLVVKPCTPTLVFYRVLAHKMCTTQLVREASVKRMLWMHCQRQINQLLLCEVVDTSLNSQALWWSKPKCFIPPRWMQLLFRRRFILRTNRSSARTKVWSFFWFLLSCMVLNTKHMFWCHILHCLSGMLRTHRSALTDWMAAFLLFQVFWTETLKKSNSYV